MRGSVCVFGLVESHYFLLSFSVSFDFAVASQAAFFRGLFLFLQFVWSGVGSPRCLGWFGGKSEVPCHPCSRAPPLSKHLGESWGWAVPACRVAMDTSLLCLNCSGPHQPVGHQFPSSSIGDEFN